MTKENTYLEMPDDVFKTHIEQVKEAMGEKKLSTIQFFGESISEDTQTKLDENASLTTQVNTLEKAASAGVVSEDVKKIAKLNIDSAVSEIEKIDENFPVKGILDSVSDPFQKIDVLGHVKTAAIYSKKAVDAVKAEIGSKTNVQAFGEAPASSDADADALVDKLIADSGVKVV